MRSLISKGDIRPTRVRGAFVFAMMTHVLAMMTLGAGNARSQSPTSLASTTEATPPSVHWTFDPEHGQPMELVGNVARDQPGPQPPEYPDFDADNTAMEFSGGHIIVPDPLDSERFDFDNGDSITLEAWLSIDKGVNGKTMYIVGKGRTGSPKFRPDNQNWALRAVVRDGLARPSFLFATPDRSTRAHWHRWTATSGVMPDSGWHHFAISYQFGAPNSIRAYIDGVSVSGQWDMGGATSAAPVVDDDAVWIGSGNGGNHSNRFRGLLDEISIHRRVLQPAEIASRSRRVGGPQFTGPATESMPDLGALPRGKVRLSIHEGIAAHGRWRMRHETWPEPTIVASLDHFLLSRLPIAFDDWGIRRDWKPPLLARLAGDVPLPTGKHRVLVRTRSLARLWFNGQCVVRNPVARRRTGNLEAVSPVPEPPMPGGRRLGFTQQESEGWLTIKEQAAKTPNRFVLEWTVGDRDRRVQTGEVCVAIQFHGEGDYFILTPRDSSALSLHDKAVQLALRGTERAMTEQDDHRRRIAATKQASYWHRRHQRARDYLSETPTPDPPTLESHPIDSFLKARVRRALENAKTPQVKESAQFLTNVLPVLREHCFRCHGAQAQGGLRLDSGESIRSAGDSESPAVVPGSPQESELMHRVTSGEMPPGEEGLSTEQVRALEDWIKSGAHWPDPPVNPADLQFAPIVDDGPFLRRAFFDVVGLPPPPDRIVAFLQDAQPDKRERLIDELLADDRYADHWVSMWMDLLAENPTLLNVSLGSTGPFRFFLHDSLRDNKPLDRMVTELVMMRGSVARGGSAGFGIAGENDSPMAAKAHVLASAFLGVEMGCARCHDAPFHQSTQEDLFSIAAMLARKPLRPPASSRVPDEFFENQTRKSLIRVTLAANQQVTPSWPLEAHIAFAEPTDLDDWLRDPNDSRERLAALLTHPGNRRFAKVIVNHFWNRLIGAGLVQPLDDWESSKPSHPELLAWLADDFVLNGYDLKHLIRRIMLSKAYARRSAATNKTADPDRRFFTAPDKRRLSAEQVVDALYAASGSEMDVEELTFVHDNSHTHAKRLTLGKPKRAWMFASLNNERDRPSLSMPKAQSITDVLEAFGWTGNRQQPVADRDTEPNVLQPAILANGDWARHQTAASWNSDLAKIAIETESPDELINQLFLRFLSRFPRPSERVVYRDALIPGFSGRLRAPDPKMIPDPADPLPVSTWTNHLQPEANQVQLQRQRRVRLGPPPDPRLEPTWREVYEDVIWSLVNHREFVFLP